MNFSLNEEQQAVRDLAVQIIDHHRRAVFGEQQRNRAPDAPPRAGDDGRLAFE